MIRASVDGFHYPRAERYRRGTDSPEGYFTDSFDYPTPIKTLLMPLGPSGDRRYKRVAFDFLTDSPLHEPIRLAPIDAVLLFDGVFLLREELYAYWDFRLITTSQSELCFLFVASSQTRSG